MKYIPQIEPWIDGAELKQLEEVISSTFITENKKTEEFLNQICQLTGSPHAIATSNGTLALVASLLSAGIGDGDEVIVPDLTFIATSNAVILVGAKPVFCDVLPTSGCLDVDACAELINEKTKAIIPVHLYGQSVEMEQLEALVTKHGIVVIEDAAESMGVFYKGKHTGTFGDYGIFSFFGNKLITCGEGGVVLTKTTENYKELYRIKNHGRDRKGIFIHENVGYNFCFTDLQAAIGVAQLQKYETMITAKKSHFKLYSQLLADIDEVEVVDVPDYVDSNYWFVNILLESPADLNDYLESKGIGTRRYFYPLHLQPCYQPLQRDCPNSLALYEKGLSLPSSVLLKEDEIKYVCSQIRSFYTSKLKR
ncbi:MAG: DegT/DnrJ/EryC1/StrS family aminotransferase [Gammaproteobacteria bacterium]|nr:DegT/DnrJ/EryC1/StrS family aminotransferase [Gammaproteobacteria bacterium]